MSIWKPVMGGRAAVFPAVSPAAANPAAENIKRITPTYLAADLFMAQLLDWDYIAN